jgi:TFIIF-interacting CTD phosphatase-like protein
MGSRSYAHSVVKLFDQDGRLFNDRILSRDDNEIIENRKKLERIFPTDDRMVLVIDDRTDVWPDCKNLIQVPAYNFFIGTGDINSPTGRIDGEAGIQEETLSTLINPKDDVLLTIERVKINLELSNVIITFSFL